MPWVRPRIMFTLHEAPRPLPDLESLELLHVPLRTHVAKFDLLLDLTQTDSGLEGFFEYNVDLFDPATVERAAGHYATLLASIARNPDAPVLELPMLTEAEQRELLGR